MKYSEHVIAWANDMIDREMREVYDAISQEHFFEKTDTENAAIHRANIQEMQDYLAQLDEMRKAVEG